jgi:hypothetical protein
MMSEQGEVPGVTPLVVVVLSKGLSLELLIPISVLRAVIIRKLST